MDRVGDDFFARTGFAFDEDGRFGRRDLADEIENVVHHPGFPDQLVDLVGLPDLGDELAVLGFEGFPVERPFEKHLHFVEVERFRDEMPGSAAHRLDGGID